MSEKNLKSYDIASFDIEIEYNSQIAPIMKKIDKLNKNHETKSLKAHKDFLNKEKKSKEKINELNDKDIIKIQKIEKAVENKIKKLRNKEARYKKEFDQFKEEQTEASLKECQVIREAKEELQKEEIIDIQAVKKKYKENIESYVEKLNIYNDNFENNKKNHDEEIKKYQILINENSKRIIKYQKDLLKRIEIELNEFIETRKKQDEETYANEKETTRILSNQSTQIRKDSNLRIHEINDYVDALKNEYSVRLEKDQQFIENSIDELESSFAKRRLLIEKDLELNLEKLNDQIKEIGETKNKKALKNITMKIDLFNLRATTTIRYEERIYEEKLQLIKNEKRILDENLEFELNNFEKLRTILLNDENELKNTGDYFKTLNLTMKHELNNFELSNNQYLVKHEQLKVEFESNYAKIFTELKQSLIDLSQTYLEKISSNNHEIDEINKFLDTAEPLKEIEVNRLRQNIEVNEISERFKIKQAKQDFEEKVIKNKLNNLIAVEEVKVKDLLSENNKEIADIKNKEIYDKALEKAKLKHSRAQEIYKLRLNNTKLERNLLQNRYETELDIFAFQKSIAAINVRKHNSLISKEIEYEIKNLETEKKYKIEVINKGLEEDLLNHEEQMSKYIFERDSFSSAIDIEIERKKLEILRQKDKISIETDEKIRMIEHALERELREPSKNIMKTETIVDERLSKLDLNNGIFIDFINDSAERFYDERLSLDQIRELVLNNDTLFDKSDKYINRAYSVYEDAVKFMNDIEKHSLLNKIAATADQSTIKKYRKQQIRIEQESKVQLNEVHKSQEDYRVITRNFIEEEIRKLGLFNTEIIKEFINQTELTYNRIFDKLKDLQLKLKNEVIELYSPLTKADQELINYANINAEKAKKLVNDNKEKQFKPINDELAKFIEEKEIVRTEHNDTINQKIADLKAEINHLKNTALDQVKEINEDTNQLIKAKREQKQIIEETEEKEITTQNEAIDNEIADLLMTYNEALEKLIQKDDEAKKIFDYEDRIYNIAVESATSRFNDANIKTENIHINNIQNGRIQLENIKKQNDTYLSEINKNLLNLTKEFEKNIFTVRPRLEESIGDAQKAIDIEIAEKEQRLIDLNENNARIVQSAENNLYSTYQEGYEKLRNNLSYYLEKYRVIETDYIESNNASNDIINENNVVFGQALVELGKQKHTQTLESLLDINKKMLGEGE